ncbi:hypothetical protein GCM10008939_37450 [Deinococcus aquiradiocola]|uniref:Uncharacterized protein n=1 Tax=Deinococcus aquiradiocola TaxID=393059 RepID=A0A917UWC1_9DEIO|nr:hypothetical protein GCM10008939_37450 [Deinococcus aquiradiocola]
MYQALPGCGSCAGPCRDVTPERACLWEEPRVCATLVRLVRRQRQADAPLVYGFKSVQDREKGRLR